MPVSKKQTKVKTCQRGNPAKERLLQRWWTKPSQFKVKQKAMPTERLFSLDVGKLWKAGRVKNVGGQRSAGGGAQRDCGISLSKGFQDVARQCQGWWPAVAQLFELDDSRGFLQTPFLQLYVLVTEGQHLLSITMYFLGMNLASNIAMLCSCWTWKGRSGEVEHVCTHYKPVTLLEFCSKFV